MAAVECHVTHISHAPGQTNSPIDGLLNVDTETFSSWWCVQAVKCQSDPSLFHTLHHPYHLPSPDNTATNDSNFILSHLSLLLPLWPVPQALLTMASLHHGWLLNISYVTMPSLHPRCLWYVSKQEAQQPQKDRTMRCFTSYGNYKCFKQQKWPLRSLAIGQFDRPRMIFQ